MTLIFTQLSKDGCIQKVINKVILIHQAFTYACRWDVCITRFRPASQGSDPSGEVEVALPRDWTGQGWLKRSACVMHCAWLPLLKHFTNGINVPSALVLGRASRAGRGGVGAAHAETEKGEVKRQLNLSRWHLFDFLRSHLEFTLLMTSSSNSGPPANCGTHRTYTHTYRTREQPGPSVLRWGAWEVYACVCMCLLLFGGRRSANTNVFISTPVKMSSLCLFSPHSEWHNTGPEDAIINLNVSWHFLTPLSTA